MTPNHQQQTEAIIAVLAQHPQGMVRGQIAGEITFPINIKTLQRRLAALSSQGRIIKQGEKKATRYYPPHISIETDKGHWMDKGQLKDNSVDIFSPQNRERLTFLELPLYMRSKKPYNRDFLDAYVPNKSAYIPEKIRRALFEAGKRFDEQLAAGTYARQICQRLLIDLSYHSSRLEGNTYSQLDTQKLVEEGVLAEDKFHEETVMIINHKEAILFLVENAQEIELNGLAIRNLHYLLSQDLLANPEACGNIRTIAVTIGKSAYKPLDNPQVLRELFELVLYKAKKIQDPFEQSFFLLIHLSYLQAFEDVNKRTARLSCNIPFIKHNLCPLSFTDVAVEDYTAALLAVYENNDPYPMLELFAWAYSRSCEQYGVVKKSLGEIDAFRIQYRQQKKAIMGRVVQQNLHGAKAEALIEHYCREQGIEAIDKFVAMTLADLATLHAGAIVGLGIKQTQLDVWLRDRVQRYNI